MSTSAGGKFLVENLPDSPFGVRVSHLATADLDVPDVRAALYDLWIQKGLIIFSGLEGSDVHIKLSQCFGQLMSASARELNDPNHPELQIIKYDDDDGWIMDVDGEMLGGWQEWHIDGNHTLNQNHGGILRPIVLPSRKGETGFIDSIESYETLSPELKEKIQDLSVIYKIELRLEKRKFAVRQHVTTIKYSNGHLSLFERLDEFPRVAHPMVYVQKETGRKILNVSPMHAIGILGMENQEGDELLEQVMLHCTEPSRAYFHRYKLDEMVLWDNQRMLHCARGGPANEPRHMVRTTIAGDYDLGQVLT